jgi:RsiW-degrading membrane proteinase PrsW (M82 family)
VTEPSSLPTALLLAGLPSAAYVLILNAIDRYEKEPWKLLIASVVAGAIVVPLISMAILAALGHGFALPLGYASGGAADPVARIVEQIVVGMVLLAVIRTVRQEFDDTLDGIVYGAAIGAGLGAAETFLYVVGGTSGLPPETMLVLLAAGLNQAFYGAVFGAVAGTVAHWRHRGRAAIVLVLGIATAALLSSLHDTLPAMLSRLVERPDATTGTLTRAIAFLVNVLGILLLGGIVWSAWGREARILRAYLAPEANAGLTSREEIAALTSARSRLAREAGAIRRADLRGFRDTRQLDAALGELAFHNYRTAVRSTPPRPEVGDALRERIRTLRALPGREGRDAS